MKIPFCDFEQQRKEYKDEILDTLSQVIDSGHFIQGSEVRELENKLQERTGARHCLTCANGTDALSIALKALSIKDGDEVILPAFTYFATAEVISDIGAIPVFVDVEENFQIAAREVEKAITEKTKAVMAVSLFGAMPDFKALLAICGKHNLPLIEDGAQSFGASSPAGKSLNVATISTTSFFPTKPLGCYGDGGAIFTNSDHLAEKIRLIRNHGQSKKYTHIGIGQNSRLDTMQAAVLLVKLKYLDRELERRELLAERYKQELIDLESYILPDPPSDQRVVWAQFTLRHTARDQIINELKDSGIPTAIHYPLPVYRQSAYDVDSGAKCKAMDCPVAEKISNQVFSIPFCAFTKESTQDQVIQALKQITQQI